MSAERPELPDLIRIAERRRGLAVRLCLFALANLLLLVGIIGFVMPGLPGFPFAIGGVLLMGASSRRVAGWLNRRERRLPDRLRTCIRKLLRRPTRASAQ